MIAPAAKSKRKMSPPKRLSRNRRPADMTLEAWQIALRREHGRVQGYRLKNLGGEAVFSEFEVTNPSTGRAYRVAIRGRNPGENYCSCPDFAVNTLGTCKHVEFVLGRIEKRPAGRAALAAGFRPPYSEVYLRYGARREVAFRPGRDCPPGLLRLAGKYFGADGPLRPERFADFERFVREANADGHETRCYDDALVFVGRCRDRERLGARLARMFPRGPASAALERLLKVPLYPYQREGALFCARAGRSLLADDMGLGKTVQAIAAAEILARAAGVERVLVVCPTSVKHQWQQEVERFSGRSAMVVQGLLAARARCYAAPSFYKIVNYEVIHRDLGAIRAWGPDLVVLDEAQRIKNWKTRRAQAAKSLESEHAVVLTGTPLENRLEELHSIVEFVDRFRLGPLFRFLDGHQHLDERGRVVGYRDLSRISRTLEPVLLRRTKDQVLRELPERIEKRLFLPMTEQQWKHHEENKEIVGRIVAKWRRIGFLSERDQQRLMIALQNMRMSCNSTYLLDQTTDFGVKADEAVAVLADILDRPEEKAVVFSQWVRTHELLRRRLKDRGWGHVLFHGGVPGPGRRELVRRFREDPECRLFLSTDAGGVGLNLQHAAAVVNMDLPWNPAVLEQRIGRVHRLGQRRPVRVVHLVAEGTIEHGMLEVLAFKKSLFEGVLDGGRDEVFLGGSRLKRFMESVEKVTGSIPEPPPAEEPAEPEPQGGKAAEPEESETAAAVSAARAAPAGAGVPVAPAATGAAPVGTREAALAELVSAGGQFLEKLCAALTAGGGPAGASGSPAVGRDTPLVERDERTGRNYLRLPLPAADVLERLAGLLGAAAGKK